LKTREAWLETAIKKLIPVFKKAGYIIPKNIKVSCGWPSGKVGKTLGECWSPNCSKSKSHEIFIAPTLERVHDPVGVVAILIHELIHAAVGIECGHKAVFKRAMKQIGLEGKAKATNANKELCAEIKTITKILGPYPHRSMVPGSRVIKTQTTRYIKVGCPNCEYICRVTRVHLDNAGAPYCPTHRKQFIEL